MVSVKFTGNNETYGGTSFDVLTTLEVPQYATSTPDASGMSLRQFGYGNGMNGLGKKSGDFMFYQNEAGKSVLSDILLTAGTSGADVELMHISGIDLATDFTFSSYGTVEGKVALLQLLSQLLVGDDTFRLSGPLSSIHGDLRNAVSGVTIETGDDRMLFDFRASVAAGYEALKIVGDVDLVHEGASVTGGDDFINAYIYGNVVAYGDFGWVEGEVAYGDDRIITGVGNDVIYGDAWEAASGGNDVLIASSGTDTLYGGGGNDVLDGGSQADVLNGGNGFDIAAYDSGYPDQMNMIVDLADPSQSTGGAYGDTFVGIEGLRGRDHDWYLDDLRGDAGGNRIWARGGNDTLDGRGGRDWLYGGEGADRLTGGTGRDLFVFTGLGDSTAAATGRDAILDFTAQDDIDLHLIDANAQARGDQAFTFIGTAGFSGAAGELRYVAAGDSTLVQGDVNGDRKADFAIELDDAMALKAGYFVL